MLGNLSPGLTAYIEMESDEDGSDEFQYPVTPTTSSMPLFAGTETSDYFSPQRSHPTSFDLTPQLSQAADFRVPTHDAPQKVTTPRWRPPAPHELHAKWEKDGEVTNCYECHRRFTFLLRKVGTFRFNHIFVSMVNCRYA
jgi:hypothetical protein